MSTATLAGDQVEGGSGLTVRRSLRTGWIYAGLAALALLVFAVLAEGGKTATFVFATTEDTWHLPSMGVPARPGALLLGLVCAGIAAYELLRGFTGRLRPLMTALFAAAWVLAFLCWVVAGKEMSLVRLAQGSLLLAVPLILGSQSGVLCERSGVVNIAIEGQLLAGAFAGAVLASVTGNLWIGLLAAPLAGLLIAALLGLFALGYAVDQVIVGVVLNVFVLGITGFLYDRLLQPEQDTYNSPDVFQAIEIPGLAHLPVLGPVLFRQSIIVYFMFAIVAVIQVGLFRTRWGLRVRAVGEHPTAADTVGIHVLRTRWRNVLYGGLVAGFGGAFFTIGSVGAFAKGMTAGQGFIALAAMIFGRWNPIGALFAALFFGFADQLQTMLSGIGTSIPPEFMLMTPYVLTIFAVAGLVGRVRAPAADGVPYTKG